MKSLAVELLPMNHSVDLSSFFKSWGMFSLSYYKKHKQTICLLINRNVRTGRDEGTIVNYVVGSGRSLERF